MFEKIKNWFNEVPVPPAWVQSIQSMILTQDVLLVKQRDRIESLEKQLAVILKQIDNDALVVAKLNEQLQEMDHCLSEIVQFSREMREESTVEYQSQLPIKIELKTTLKVGEKVRVQNHAGLGEDFDGKTGRITLTKFSDSGSGYMLYTVRFPRKIQGSAIHEFYDDEIEIVEE
jgi:hypothetical protein